MGGGRGMKTGWFEEADKTYRKMSRKQIDKMMSEYNQRLIDYEKETGAKRVSIDGSLWFEWRGGRKP